MGRRSGLLAVQPSIAPKDEFFNILKGTHAVLAIGFTAILVHFAGAMFPPSSAHGLMRGRSEPVRSEPGLDASRA
jgi:hypothetical protein